MWGPAAIGDGEVAGLGIREWCFAFQSGARCRGAREYLPATGIAHQRIGVMSRAGIHGDEAPIKVFRAGVALQGLFEQWQGVRHLSGRAQGPAALRQETGKLRA